jgi:hypothetical protein
MAIMAILSLVLLSALGTTAQASGRRPWAAPGRRATSVDIAPDFRPNATIEGARLRADLLESYDKWMPPTSDRSAYGTEYSQAGTDVRMQIRFFKLNEVQAAAGSMSLKVWNRMYWQDTRLSWDPADYSGLESTYFFTDPADPDPSEVWVPDIQPYNARESIKASLDAGVMKVSYTGEVFWSRPGAFVAPKLVIRMPRLPKPCP